MSGMKKLVLAAVALLALPFSAKAEVVIGVGIPGPFYRPYHHGWYHRPYVVVAPPVIVAPPPRVIYVAPPPGTVYVQPTAPPPAPVYVPR